MRISMQDAIRDDVILWRFSCCKFEMEARKYGDGDGRLRRLNEVMSDVTTAAERSTSNASKVPDDLINFCRCCLISHTCFGECGSPISGLPCYDYREATPKQPVSAQLFKSSSIGLVLLGRHCHCARVIQYPESLCAARMIMLKAEHRCSPT